jgi:adenine-specific DNA-methyltransferase
MMEKLNGKSKDIVKENIEKLKNIFPEIFTEEKIDFDKLQETLGSYMEDKEERYDFTWNGKSRARRIAQTPSTGTLRPCKEESVDWDNTENLFIEGDNLEVLKLLQKSYHKKVKMIYIDPPYNTGNDFIYKDDYKDNLKNYLEITGQLDEAGKKLSVNPETSGRYHTDWLNMMYPRLKLARNLLKDDGVIFISIDDNEVSNLRKVCDDIFGEENFLGTFVWKTRQASGKQIKINNFSSEHEYVICFQKKDDFIFNGIKRKRESYCNPDNDPRGDWAKHPLDVGSTREERPNCFYTLIDPKTGKEYKANPNRVWAYSKLTMNKLLKEKKILFPKRNGRPYLKKFWDELRSEYKPISSWLDKDGFEVGYNTEGTKIVNKLFEPLKVFDYPKPITFLKILIEQSTNNNEVVLDFFAGSCSTAQAVIEKCFKDNVGRNFIMVQLPEPCNKKSEAFKAGYKTIADIGKERIRRVIKKIKSEQEEQNKKNKETLFNDNKGENNQKLDLGFKVFKLDSSNIKTWDTSIEDLEQNLLDSVNNVKSDRSTEDVIYEILLKYGLDLTVPIEEINISDKKIYSIGYGALIICLEKDIQEEVIKGIIKLKNDLKPEAIRVVFSDSSFKDDSMKMNAIENLKQNGIEDIKSL